MGNQTLGTALTGSRSTIHVWLGTCFSGPLRPRGKLKNITRFTLAFALQHNAYIILCRALRVAGDSGIVYCWTLKHCKSLAESLIKEGLVACSYHSKMSDEDKERVQEKWNENECQVALFNFLL